MPETIETGIRKQWVAFFKVGGGGGGKKRLL